MTYEELRRIAETVGERAGWDFSRVRDDRDPVPWEYPDVARRYLRPEHRVLDVGTGGGERFAELAPHFGEGIGIDASPEMVAHARAHLPLHLAEKLSFAVARAEALPFPDGSFDVVLNRHAPLHAAELLRVLRPGGLLVTQQVGPRNTANIDAAFGVDPAQTFAVEGSEPADTHVAGVVAAGVRVLARGEYDVRYRFLDVESLLYWLKAVPVPRDFDLERHWRQVAEIVERLGTPRGIETNEHRELLVAEKP